MSHPENERISAGRSIDDVELSPMERESPSSAEQRKSSGQSSVTSTTMVPAAEKSQASPGQQLARADDSDALYAHLPEHEKQILKKQLDADDVDVSFFGLFRYASRADIAIMIVSGICAIIAGAALPLFTVSAIPDRIS